MKSKLYIALITGGFCFSELSVGKEATSKVDMQSELSKFDKISAAIKKAAEGGKRPGRLIELVPAFLPNKESLIINGTKIPGGFTSICYIPDDAIQNPDDPNGAKMIAFLTAELDKGGRLIITSDYQVWHIGEAAFQSWMAGVPIIR